MSDGELFLLKRDIEAHGLKEPIVIDQRGQILDGLNRYRAIQQIVDELAGEPPSVRKPVLEKLNYREVEGEATQEFVVAANLARRHLSPSQKCMYVAQFILHDGGKRKRKLNVSELAKRYGLKRPTLYKASYILTHYEDAAERASAANRDEMLALPNDVLEGRKSVGKAEAEIVAVLNAEAKKTPRAELQQMKTELTAAIEGLNNKQLAKFEPQIRKLLQLLGDSNEAS